MTMNFYEFRQNNSGGAFDQDENLSVVVLIEAESARAANEKAESIGIYFDGCASGTDCPCCGDRWRQVCEDEWDVTDDAQVKELLSGEDVYIPDGYFGCSPSVIAHYADGTKRTNKIPS